MNFRFGGTSSFSVAFTVFPSFFDHPSNCFRLWILEMGCTSARNAARNSQHISHVLC